MKKKLWNHFDKRENKTLSWQRQRISKYVFCPSCLAWTIGFLVLPSPVDEWGKFYPKKVIQIGGVNFCPEELTEKNIIQRLTWLIWPYFLDKKVSPKIMRLILPYFIGEKILKWLLSSYIYAVTGVL